MRRGYGDKIPRASDSARSYGPDDPRTESAARRKVLEEKRAKQEEARAPQGVSEGAGSGDGKVAISINGILVGEVSALDLVPQGSVAIRATPLKGKLSLEIEGTASGTGGGATPIGAPYVVTTTDPDLTNEQVLTDGTWIEWDISTPGVVIADIIAGSITTTELGGDITAAGEAILTGANAAAQRTTLGLGTAAVENVAYFALASHTHAAADIVSGTIATARLGSGAATSSTYLRGDQTWQLLPSMTVSDGDKGDITVSSTGSVWTIDNDVVTYAKMQNISAASRLLGRGSASGSGDTQEMTVSGNLSISATDLVGATKVMENSTTDYSRSKINLIEGQGISMTFTDDGANDRVDVQVELDRYIRMDAGTYPFGTNTASAQDWFDTDGDANVAAGAYIFEGQLILGYEAAPTTHTIAVQFNAGSATIESLAYVVMGQNTAETTTSNVQTTTFRTDGAAQVTTATATSERWVQVRGTVRLSTSGTFIPQFVCSAAPGAAQRPVIYPGTYFKLERIGAYTVTEVGSWT